MMNPSQKKRRRQWLLWLNVLALTCLLLAPAAPAFAQSDGSDAAGNVVDTAVDPVPPGPMPAQADTPVVPGVPGINVPPAQPIPQAQASPLPQGNNFLFLPLLSQPTQTAAEVQAAATTKTIDMKVLVVSADGKETGLQAITMTLSQLGVPYEVMVVTQVTPALTPAALTAKLSNGVDRGYYQGIILANGATSYVNSSGQFTQAFSRDHWLALWQYEATFGVRQVTWETSLASVPDWQGAPGNYGLTYAGERDTTNQPLTATFTDAGKQIFFDLNTSNPVTIKNAWTYLGTVADTKVTTPLLTTTEGYAIASITGYSDGRQNLAITTTHNPQLIHSLQLAYGTVNWLTKGLFLGFRKVWINPQVDDLFIDSDMWDIGALTDTTGISSRMTGQDFLNAITWQKNTRAAYSPLANTLTLEWAFNGEGTTNIWDFTDTLSPIVKTNQSAFAYVNHTYTHLNLDAPTTYTDTVTELTQNNSVATAFKFSTYSKDTMVQPDISGLYNQDFANGAAAYGIKYLISDTSRPGWDNPSPNAGFYWTLKPSILIIPRKPTNLFYNLATPEQWVSEYNCYYGPQAQCAGGIFKYWDHDLSYQEILDKESDFWLQYLLKWNIDPLMFHQANVISYSGTNSLLGDLVNATLAKYKAVYNLPITYITEHNIGIKMADRMTYNASGVTASMIPCQSMTIKTVKAATIPVTGVLVNLTGATGATGVKVSSEPYGPVGKPQTISYVSMPANRTLTVKLTCP